jgi:hypothetical protein
MTLTSPFSQKKNKIQDAKKIPWNLVAQVIGFSAFNESNRFTLLGKRSVVFNKNSKI